MSLQEMKTEQKQGIYDKQSWQNSPSGSKYGQRSHEMEIQMTDFSSLKELSSVKSPSLVVGDGGRDHQFKYS